MKISECALYGCLRLLQLEMLYNCVDAQIVRHVPEEEGYLTEDGQR